MNGRRILDICGASGQIRHIMVLIPMVLINPIRTFTFIVKNSALPLYKYSKKISNEKIAKQIKSKLRIKPVT